ncbi:restriction endonuclease subunit S [candidate division BRC1 bacterium HGW-BRC1-1]|jgi:type I restriction enzyme S subunit|nr:MAG: restriction endonuclease subunit S [candidate division BRC1 bacterium HGW-BRC1-1]
MKEGWQKKRLGELADIELGKTPARANASLWDGKRETGNVWLSIADLLSAEDNVVVDSREYVSDRGAAMCKLVPKGTLLVSFKLTLGRLAFAGRDLHTNEAIAALTLFDERELSKEFLFWFLQFFDWVKAAENDVKLKGMTLNKAKLKQMNVHFPKSLTQQRRIVGILDEAFDGIATAKANAEKNLQNARAIFESHLQSVFRNKKWKWKALGDLCDRVEYGSSAKSKNEGRVPVLRMGNIQDGKLDWGNLVYTNDKDEIAKYLLKHNDVLFNRTNSPELVGKTAIYKSEIPAIFAGYLIRIHRKEALLDGDYLNYFLNSQIAFDYGKTVVISSVNQANINGSKLKEYPIPAPSLVEQRQIVEKFDALAAETQRLESLYQQKLAALEALKKSLLHQAFTGEL